MRNDFEFDHSATFELKRAAEILAAVPAAAGVFALFGHADADQPYLTRTANLRRRLTRLLTPENSHPEKLDAEAAADSAPVVSRRLNLGGRVARIEYSATGSEFEATLLLYRASVALLGMESAERRLRLHTPYMVRMAVENAYPRAYVTNRIAAKAAENFYGPFPARAAAERFLEESLNLFKLRRCYEDLNPDPAFPGCVYSEMKMCLAPCFKGCSEERYAEETQAVRAYLGTRGASLMTGIAAARDAASEELDFERAAQLHAAMSKALAAAQLADEIVRPISQLDALVVQAGGDDAAALFLVRGGLLAGPVKMPASTAEENIVEALAVLEGQAEEVRRGKNAGKLLGCHLALLKRWYYRAEKQRRGEIFFRNDAGEFPLRRIARAVGRASGIPKNAPAVAAPDLAEPAAAADTLAIE